MKPSDWRPISDAPKDETEILVWFDHAADPYQDPENPKRLTSYAVWAENSDFMVGTGFCIAKWFEGTFETTGDYGEGYWLPGWWFERGNDDFERVVNPIYWMPLVKPENTNGQRRLTSPPLPPSRGRG